MLRDFRFWAACTPLRNDLAIPRYEGDPVHFLGVPRLQQNSAVLLNLKSIKSLQRRKEKTRGQGFFLVTFAAKNKWTTDKPIENGLKVPQNVESSPVLMKL